jgi:hypothetical protein
MYCSVFTLIFTLEEFIDVDCITVFSMYRRNVITVFRSVDLNYRWEESKDIVELGNDFFGRPTRMTWSLLCVSFSRG